MGQTIAEMYIEQGREKGRVEGKIEGKIEGELERARTILLRQLRKRFKKVPRKVEARIAATTNMQHLERWLDNILGSSVFRCNTWQNGLGCARPGGVGQRSSGPPFSKPS